MRRWRGATVGFENRVPAAGVCGS